MSVNEMPRSICLLQREICVFRGTVVAAVGAGGHRLVPQTSLSITAGQAQPAGWGCHVSREVCWPADSRIHKEAQMEETRVKGTNAGQKEQEWIRASALGLGPRDALGKALRSNKGAAGSVGQHPPETTLPRKLCSFRKF